MRLNKKIQISLFFFILAAALVFAAFELPDFLNRSRAQDDAVEMSKSFSKSDVLTYFTKTELFDYLGNATKIDSELLNSADVVTVHLWASWCAPCVNEVPELIDFAKRVTAKNEQNLKVVFITVSLDEQVEDLNKFLKSFPEFNQNPFLRIWDKNKTLSKLLNADRLPMTVILNKKINEPRVVRGVVEWKTINF